MAAWVEGEGCVARMLSTKASEDFNRIWCREVAAEGSDEAVSASAREGARSDETSL